MINNYLSTYFTALNSKVGVRMDENQLQILDDLPSSAVEMQVKDKACCRICVTLLSSNILIII